MSGLNRLTVGFMTLVYFLTPVSCQVRGFIGDDVLLPCVYPVKEPGSVFVFWRDRNNNHVFDIKQGKADLSSQSQTFNKRVESFPDQYKKGNFSIVLKNLQPSDSGLYECSIPEEDNFQMDVSLTVSGKRVEAAATPAPLGRSTAVKLSSLHVTLLLVLLALVV